MKNTTLIQFPVKQHLVALGFDYGKITAGMVFTRHSQAFIVDLIELPFQRATGCHYEFHLEIEIECVDFVFKEVKRIGAWIVKWHKQSAEPEILEYNVFTQATWLPTRTYLVQEMQNIIHFDEYDLVALNYRWEQADISIRLPCSEILKGKWIHRKNDKRKLIEHL